MTALFSTLPPLSPADLIDGRYEVLRPIAKGGMGEVLEARHVHDARVVALKVARPEIADRSDVRERLRREIESLNKLRHPGIVSLLDSGTCRRRGPYLVMEKFHGRSLDGLLAARGNLGVAGAIRVLREMATALAEVHERGFVHRDVKPGNVFVSQKRPGVDALKLIDFGLVAPATPALGLSGHGLTLDGEILGSLGYMSPEQLEHASRADARSDLYSLALVVIECMGGVSSDVSARFSGSKLASQALAGVLGVPPGLVKLLDDMLAPEPARRPDCAPEVLLRLEQEVEALESPHLLGYGQPQRSREEPTLCEPASRRAVAMADARRTTQRAPYGTPMMLLHGTGSIAGRIEDVSVGGLLAVTTGAGDAELQDVRVRFALPTTGAVVTIPCEVRWARKNPGRTALGLSFKNLAPDFAAAIATYVEWHVRWLVVAG